MPLRALMLLGNFNHHKIDKCTLAYIFLIQGDALHIFGFSVQGGTCHGVYHQSTDQVSMTGRALIAFDWYTNNKSGWKKDEDKRKCISFYLQWSYKTPFGLSIRRKQSFIIRKCPPLQTQSNYWYWARIDNKTPPKTGVQQLEPILSRTLMRKCLAPSGGLFDITFSHFLRHLQVGSMGAAGWWRQHRLPRCLRGHTRWSACCEQRGASRRHPTLLAGKRRRLDMCHGGFAHEYRYCLFLHALLTCTHTGSHAVAAATVGD